MDNTPSNFSKTSGDAFLASLDLAVKAVAQQVHSGQISKAVITNFASEVSALSARFNHDKFRDPEWAATPEGVRAVALDKLEERLRIDTGKNISDLASDEYWEIKRSAQVKYLREIFAVQDEYDRATGRVEPVVYSLCAQKGRASWFPPSTYTDLELAFADLALCENEIYATITRS